MPVNTSYASHVDPTYLADADGALDDDEHVEGIHRAMRDNWLAAWMMMTEQFVNTMVSQTFIIGTFLDAKQQLEVQRLFQELTAEAHKDFQPSWQMCEFGTTVRSLAASEMVAWENTRMLDSILEKSDHLHAGLATAGGIAVDSTHRIKNFRDVYCDLDENNQEVDLLCDESEGPQDRRSKDIDYPRLLDSAYTLDVNYGDGDSSETPTEKDIIALARNLYGAPVFDFFPEQLANEATGQSLFMEARSVYAIRSVARHSFASMVGMKAEGEQDTIWNVRPFLYGIISELGVPTDEIEDFLGENPSYFAQMEVLTQKIYQSPEFFTNLYDKPANVKRISVALQALELMQDRDRFETALRREMLISMILELKVRQYQEDVNTTIFSATNVKHGVGTISP